MLTRRDLLLNGVRATALASVAPYASAATREQTRALVVIELNGGNDGLNTVVPFGQDAYYKLRPNLGLAPGALHEVGDGIGLHPSCSGLAEVFERGQLAIVNGVGYPNANRSHFRSLEIWRSAKVAGPAGEVGWLGHMADQIAKRSRAALPAMALEGGTLPLSMRGEKVMPPVVRDAKGLRLHASSSGFEEERDQLIAAGAGGNLGYLRQVARTTYDTARRMESVLEEPNDSPYPGHPLAQRLKLVAQLLRGRFGTQVFHLSLGGFDTHSRQKPVHEELMRQLSTAMSAFQADLEASGTADQVVTLVFSEFGRRAKENASKGTDHGQGGPVFLMGKPVQGGLHGQAPDFDRLVEGDVPGAVDFRSIYSCLERDWMETKPSSSVSPLNLLA